MRKLISQRETIRQYNKMLDSIETMKEMQYCNYYCDGCKGTTKTMQITAGTIPFKLLCPKCKSTHATSQGITEEKQKGIEFLWVRPPLKYLIKKRKYKNYIKHIFNGGLDYVPIKKEVKKNKINANEDV